MEQINIPQDNNSTLEGTKKVMYAPNSDGEFERFNYGSDVEEYATKLAVQEYEELMTTARSPIEYLMFKNRMDLQTLASIVDMFQFRVKRHLKADICKNLNDKMLNKYAIAFSISLEELKGLKV